MKRFLFWLLIFIIFVVAMYRADRVVAFFKGGQSRPPTAAEPAAPPAAKPTPPGQDPAATPPANPAAKPPTVATPAKRPPPPAPPKYRARAELRIIEKDAACTIKDLRRRTEYRLLDFRLDEVVKASDFVLLQGDKVVPALGFVVHRRSDSGWRPLVTAVGPPAKTELYRELEKGAVPGSTHLLFTEGKVTTDDNTALVLLFPGVGQQGVLLFREEEIALEIASTIAAE